MGKVTARIHGAGLMAVFATGGGQDFLRPMPQAQYSISVCCNGNSIKRMKRFELSTLSLARRCSTTELHPHGALKALN